MRSFSPSPQLGLIPIGPKLRLSRRAQGLTIAQLAEATNLTKGFISRVERDQTSPSVSTLLMLCQVLSLPVGTLFEAPEHEVIHLKEAPTVNFGGSLVGDKILTPRSEERIQLLRSTLKPGATGGADFYTIACESEVLHVLRGHITLRFPQQDFQLGPGDSLTFSGRQPHTWLNASDDVTEVIWAIVPAAWSGSN